MSVELEYVPLQRSTMYGGHFVMNNINITNQMNKKNDNMRMTIQIIKGNRNESQMFRLGVMANRMIMTNVVHLT